VTGEAGARRKRTAAFTEQGVAMLSSVLRSPRAVQVNIEIMRTFVRLRQMLRSNEELARKLAALARARSPSPSRSRTLFRTRIRSRTRIRTQPQTRIGSRAPCRAGPASRTRGPLLVCRTEG